jgi:ATP-binding protein involved in chromosome partitioning
MSEINREVVLEALRSVKYPGFSRDIVSFNLVKDIFIDGTKVGVEVVVKTSNMEVPKAIYEAATNALKRIDGVSYVDVKVDVQAVAPVLASGKLPQEAIPGVRHVIAVASGKGGVGKSTVASNLSLALMRQGLRVGLCDCDIYGPSIALMLGVKDAEPEAGKDDRLIPIEAYGLKVMSMGFFLGDEAPAVLRGPMVTRYTQQFLRQVAWGNLDVLVLDLPPGTGDIQLTVVQTVALSGAVIVTTPQEVALIDARKASAMFNKVNVPVLGLIENMSYFVCPSDGVKYAIFGEGGGKVEAERLKVPLLAQIPIDLEVRKGGDLGIPIVVRESCGAAACAFFQAAEKVLTLLNQVERRKH